MSIEKIYLNKYFRYFILAVGLIMLLISFSLLWAVLSWDNEHVAGTGMVIEVNNSDNLISYEYAGSEHIVIEHINEPDESRVVGEEVALQVNLNNPNMTTTSTKAENTKLFFMSSLFTVLFFVIFSFTTSNKPSSANSLGRDSRPK